MICIHKIINNITVAEMTTLSAAALLSFKDAEALKGDAMLDSVMSEIEKKSALLKAAGVREKKSLSLEKADSARDEILRTLFVMLQGYAVMPSQEKREAASSLLSKLSVYGLKTLSESYAIESAHIEHMLIILTSDENKAAVKALDGLGETIEALIKAEDDLKAAGEASVSEKTSKGESAYLLKKDVLSTFNVKLIPYLCACSAIDGEKYDAFSSKIAEYVERANSTVSERNKKTNKQGGAKE